MPEFSMLMTIPLDKHTFIFTEKYKDEKMIKPTINQFDFILYHPSKNKMDWKSPFHQDRWNWCDALFMSPPLWVITILKFNKR